jgi:hypothetical protein
MATVATQTINGYTIGPEMGYQRGRSEARVPAPPHSRDISPLPRNVDMPRSASYTFLPEAKEAASLPNSALVTIKGSFNERDLIVPADDIVDISPPDSSGWTTPEEIIPEPKVPVEEARRLIAELQKDPKVTVSRLAKKVEEDKSSTASSGRRGSAAHTSTESARSTSTQATKPASATPKARQSNVSSFSKRLSRKYGASEPSTPSRSPSPPKKEAILKSYQVGKDAAPAPTPIGATSRRKSFMRRRDSKSPKDAKEEAVAPKKASATPVEQATEQPVARRSTLIRRKSRPISQLFQGGKEDEPAVVHEVPEVPKVPKMPALSKSFSTDRLPTLRSQTPQPNDRAAPMPRLLSSERVPSGGISIPIRKKDELWSVFRTLEGDYTKFASKSVAFKANVVRSALLPFLRTYANHPSNRMLRPEDLDRRATILNRWWCGLIEMLHGRNNQSISGTDRPAILDGISGIMERPEWRLPPSPFCPLNQRSKVATPRDRSTTSLSSGTSEFLTESVHHNVRNIFIQNLSAQMAFVVDKMSLRNASASLVTFCGKACAYAFMFVPGMADVLARLWDLQLDTLRRVLDENGIGKFDNLDLISSSITTNFPPAIQQLGFSSLTKYMRKLRTPPPLPLGTASIEWWGRWLERWTGRESDLFYVFVKHFHILATDFLPAEPSPKQRMCAPGMLLVHAQILVNLDAVIHRDASPAPQDPTTVGPSPTFDDVLVDPDAVASALPLPPTNAVRIMAENRLIMLIRDFLSERTAEHPLARQLFAESFNDLLQATARGTSMFDHAACYTLLDFLEEALAILVRFENMSEGGKPLINSNFWLLVCKKMIESQNTTTEIRLYAFLYTIWNTIVADSTRKADLCLRLLLDREIFESRFNHWCPMVRAYYMRLLCWRVGRYDGDHQQDDLQILETMHERLQTVWSHYLHMRERAIQTQSLPPATSPCNPAPGRRLLIIRTDAQAIPNHSFLSFDGLAPRDTASASTKLASKRFSTLSHVVEMDSRPETSSSSADSDAQPPRERGIGGFFRKMMGTSRTRSRSQGPANHPKPQPAAPPVPDSASMRDGLTRAATDDLRVPRNRASVIDMTPPGTGGAKSHRNFSFKFSLEYHPNKNGPGPIRMLPPRLPLAAQTFLQTYSPVANSGPQTCAREPKGASKVHARYSSRALAEWNLVVGECQSFFERRKNEGVPSNKFVETPTLGVEVFKRPS